MLLSPVSFSSGLEIDRQIVYQIVYQIVLFTFFLFTIGWTAKEKCQWVYLFIHLVIYNNKNKNKLYINYVRLRLEFMSAVKVVPGC